jgi:hypothetical protein
MIARDRKAQRTAGSCQIPLCLVFPFYEELFGCKTKCWIFLGWCCIYLLAIERVAHCDSDGIGCKLLCFRTCWIYSKFVMLCVTECVSGGNCRSSGEFAASVDSAQRRQKVALDIRQLPPVLLFAIPLRIYREFGTTVLKPSGLLLSHLL